MVEVYNKSEIDDKVSIILLKLQDLDRAVKKLTPSSHFIDTSKMARMLCLTRAGLMGRYKRGEYKKGEHFIVKNGRILWDFAATLKYER